MFIYLYEKPRCAWIRVRKTGSTSVIRSFFLTRPNSRVYTEIPKEWKPIKSFTIVRNPYDRIASVLSMFRQHKSAVTDKEISIRNTLNVGKLISLVEDDSIVPSSEGYLGRLKIHALPMSHKLVGIHEADRVFRFEDFNKAWDGIADYLSVGKPSIVHAKSKYGKYYLSEEERSLISDYYKKDFETFGYDI